MWRMSRPRRPKDAIFVCLVIARSLRGPLVEPGGLYVVSVFSLIRRLPAADALCYDIRTLIHRPNDKPRTAHTNAAEARGARAAGRMRPRGAHASRNGRALQGLRSQISPETQPLSVIELECCREPPAGRSAGAGSAGGSCGSGPGGGLYGVVGLRGSSAAAGGGSSSSAAAESRFHALSRCAFLRSELERSLVKKLEELLPGGGQSGKPSTLGRPEASCRGPRQAS